VNWHERTDNRGKYLISEDGQQKITNEGARGGDWYCLWALYEWQGQGGTYAAYVRLTRIGTLAECQGNG
jgi:hypothetical protein